MVNFLVFLIGMTFSMELDGRWGRCEGMWVIGSGMEGGDGLGGGLILGGSVINGGIRTVFIMCGNFGHTDGTVDGKFIFN